MRSEKGVYSIITPLFSGTNILFWKVIRREYLQAIGADVWGIVESRYQYPTTIPVDTVGKKQYEANEKDINVILESMAESEFMKFMQLNTTKGMWDKLIQNYEGHIKVKGTKLQTFRIQYETLRIHGDESIASFFLE